MALGLQDANSELAFEKQIASKAHALIHFWAGWCEPCSQLDIVLGVLAEDHDAAFIRVEAEEAVDLSLKYKVTVVPLFLFFKDGKEVDRLEGADVPALTEKVKLLIPERASLSAGQPPEAAEGPLKPSRPQNGAAQPQTSRQDGLKRVEALVNQQPVMLLMKGSPDAPRCGFSSRVVKILQKQDVQFGHFDILTDDVIRQSAKVYSDWPSFPQLYVRGDLIGGCDIVEEMDESGELLDILKPASTDENAEESLDVRLHKLITSFEVMLFMKGTPDYPQCGFSSKVVQTLRSLAIAFKSFNILEDQEVREGLKKLSQWPTYPQLYAGGELIGGCDIILELSKQGTLKSEIQSALDNKI